MSIPLPGGKTAGDSNVDDLRTALASYPRLERLYNQNSATLMYLEGRTRLERILALSDGDLMAGRYLVRRSEGVPQSMMIAFAETFLAKKLNDNGDFAELTALIAEIHASRRVEPRYAPLDVAEEHTYLKAQTLDNAIVMFDAIARMKTAKSSRAKMDAALFYFRNRNQIWNAIQLFQRQDLDDQALDGIYGVLRTVNWDEPSQWPSQVLATWVENGGDRAVTLFQGDSRSTIRLTSGAEDRQIELLTGAAATASYQQQAAARLHAIESETVSPLDVRCDLGACEVIVEGQVIAITKAEVAQLKSGKSLPEKHPLTIALTSLDGKPAMALENAFTVRSSKVRGQIDEILFSLQRAYPVFLIRRDLPSEASIANSRLIGSRQPPPPSDVISILPTETFGVDDRKIVQNIRGLLQERGFPVVDVPESVDWQWKYEGGKTVLVITGHSSEQLKRYVEYLGSKGVFRGNVVILNSCGTPITRETTQQINSEFGAASTFTFSGKIPAADVEDFVIGLSADIPTHSDTPLARIILERARLSNLRGIWTVARQWPAKSHPVENASYFADAN